MALLMHDAGFIDVEAARFRWPFGDADKMTPKDDFMGALKGLAKLSVSLGGIEGVRTWEEAEAMLKKCDEEMWNRPFYCPLVCTVGRRPLNS